MANIYTRTGDAGSTGLFGGTRVPKQDIAVETYGTVDEANSAIGYAKQLVCEEYKDVLHQIQVRLFILASELASDDKGKAKLSGLISQADVDLLEGIIDKCLAVIGPTKHFVVPGRDMASASLHQARTIVRRAERNVLRMAETHPVRDEIIRYLNRLSDTLYAIARLHEEKADLTMIEAAVRCAVDKVTQAQTQAQGSLMLDLESAEAMAHAARTKATDMGVPIVFAAVDSGGNLILVHRMTDSLLASIDVAINKAYTSAALKTATENLREAAGVNGPLYGIETSNQGRLVLFGGGLPVFCQGWISGGIGVSGGSVEEDIAIVRYAFDQVVRS